MRNVMIFLECSTNDDSYYRYLNHGNMQQSDHIHFLLQDTSKSAFFWSWRKFSHEKDTVYLWKGTSTLVPEGLFNFTIHASYSRPRLKFNNDHISYDCILKMKGGERKESEILPLIPSSSVPIIGFLNQKKLPHRYLT